MRGIQIRQDALVEAIQLSPRKGAAVCQSSRSSCPGSHAVFLLWRLAQRDLFPARVPFRAGNNSVFPQVTVVGTQHNRHPNLEVACEPVSRLRVNRTASPSMHSTCSASVSPCSAPSRRARARAKPQPSTVQVTLSEWKVSLTPKEVPPGPVVLESPTPARSRTRSRSGARPRAEYIADHARRQRGLVLDLRAGTYEAYCPVGRARTRCWG